MATDGVKIIDGDHAHDVYHTFMELYDAGASFEEIQTAVEALNVGDDFDTEIFITAYALALWETGQLTEKIRQQVQQAIQRGAFVEYLTQEVRYACRRSPAPKSTEPVLAKNYSPQPEDSQAEVTENPKEPPV